jgi:hypothetical protein
MMAKDRMAEDGRMKRDGRLVEDGRMAEYGRMLKDGRRWQNVSMVGCWKIVWMVEDG